MPQNWYWQNRTITLQSENNLYSMPSYCGHKDEPTNHMHTAVNSYAPVRYLRMGAFCIFHQKISKNFPARLAFWPRSVLRVYERDITRFRGRERR